MIRYVYAIRDRVAGMLLGDVFHTFAHDAPAVRFFGDVIDQRGSIVNQHPRDFELVRLGNTTEDGMTIIGESAPRIVITGEAVLDLRAADAEVRAAQERDA